MSRSSLTSNLWLSLSAVVVVVATVSVGVSIWINNNNNNKQQTHVSKKSTKDNKKSNNNNNNNNKVKITVLYGTCTGTSRLLSTSLVNKLKTFAGVAEVAAVDMKDYDYEDLLEHEAVVLVVCYTWTDGTAPETAQPFVSWLHEQAVDFRVSKDLLNNTRFAVFGLGAGVYNNNFCTVVRISYNEFNTNEMNE